MELPMAFALSDLPLVGQHALAKHPNESVREALAASGTTHVDVINKLSRDKSGAVMLQTFSRVTDPEILTKIVGKWASGPSTMRAAQNPLLPAELLVKTLGSADFDFALSAYMNPATPLAARRKLQPEHAGNLCTDTFRMEDSGVRAYALINANLWMLEEPEKWGKAISTAIACHPETDKETLRLLQRRHGLRTLVRQHPAANKISGNTPYSVSQLIELDTTAAMQMAVRRPELTFGDIDQILSHPVTQEPAVLGSLVNRYGFGSLYINTSNDGVWRTPNAKAAVWIASVIRYVRVRNRSVYMEAMAVINILGDCPQRWETFIALLPDWHDDMVRAANTACAL